MAKKQETENELGGLPPELMVDGQEPKVQVVKEENQDFLPEQVAVVVTKGNTVRHDSQDYAENKTFSLSVEDATRLIELGVVADVNKLRKQALIQHGPTVTVSDGVKISHEA
ncbi:hypothetical protein [Photorhabdus khanii]|uniref:Uncharacterized protein n=1 Tax=Photorhabdus khanii subsp. guanajuatensis TaxID=2100166 RepID=A0A4R4J524_9GAMM|nr:hypothetical protein [Photorhabdus khanii]TDB48231.1 hypothetical protein C5467_19345 [Photorhabdus khanii subsp. guanajuatensis]